MRAVIFANGMIRRKDLILNSITKEDLLVSADGGLRHIRSLDLSPSLVVGDLDSIREDDLKYLHRNDIALLKFPKEKDRTDLEIAIDEIIKRGYQDILIIGALGGRLDQTLANIGLLVLFSNEETKIELDDGQEHVQLVREKLTIKGKQGDIISLIPLCENAEVVSTRGLKYALMKDNLLPNRTRGISNVMEGDEAIIEISKGTVICIHSRIQDE
jgi:thiamine pyrophosphokinase